MVDEYNCGEKATMNRIYGDLCKFLLVGILAAGLLLSFGCGKKAMPSAPNQAPPTAVSDLKGDLKENQIVLTWSLPQPAQTKKSISLSSIVIYRSKLPIEGGNCKNCPLRYEPLLTLAPPTKGGSPMRYMDKLESGHRYTYKVILFGENEVKSPDSNIVDITY
jgi:hypothetical protein